MVIETVETSEVKPVSGAMAVMTGGLVFELSQVRTYITVAVAVFKPMSTAMISAVFVPIASGRV